MLQHKTLSMKHGSVEAAPAAEALSAQGWSEEAFQVPEVSAVEALKRLEEGNARFVAGASRHLELDLRRRAETVLRGQHPLAAVIACSDSRVPPEILFDQGIGRLYVVRVAGNVCGVDQVASIEFAVGQLATPLLVVMGHTHCGTVAAAIGGDEFPGDLSVLLEKIRSVVDKVRREVVCLDEAHLANTVVEANVWQVIDELLERSPVARDRAAAGKLAILGAKYDTETGVIYWLGQRKVECWGY